MWPWTKHSSRRWSSQRGLQVRYAPDAMVYNMGPETVGDFVRQRRRNYAGHLYLKKEIRLQSLQPAIEAGCCALLWERYGMRFACCMSWVRWPSIEIFSRLLGRVRLLYSPRSPCRLGYGLDDQEGGPWTATGVTAIRRRNQQLLGSRSHHERSPADPAQSRHQPGADRLSALRQSRPGPGREEP